MTNKINKFSIIIPVYNRPDEVEELLASLLAQSAQNFEVLIVEDGSQTDSRAIVEKYADKLDLHYFVKPNEGPGPTRNYGSERATGDYFIYFDSDCIIPPNYLEIVNKELTESYVDAFGGPDAAHQSFTPIQKAISYAMTSFFTTGGIRGGKKKLDQFYPRSFNMGYSRQVWEQTGGFGAMRFGEDLDMSYRIVGLGFKTRLIPAAFVYHKRRTDFRKFFKQVHNSGIARINLYKRHPKTLKPVHFLPALFTVGSLLLIGASIWFWVFLLPFLLYALLIGVDALIKTQNLRVALLAVQAAYVQLLGYGTGFIRSFWKRLVLKRDEFHAFRKNFYK